MNEPEENDKFWTEVDKWFQEAQAAIRRSKGRKPHGKRNKV